MHRSLLQHFCAVAALGVFVAATPASAAGLLGQRYGSLTYDRTLVETRAYDDGGGVSLFYNHPFCDNVDLGLDYRFSSWDAARDDVGDFSDQRVQLVATGFDEGDRDDIFVRVGVGIGKVEHGDSDVTGVAWSGVIGTEYSMSESVNLQNYVGWNDVTDDGETPHFVYGVLAALNAGKAFCLTARVEGDQHYNVTLSVGGLVRF